MQPSQLHGNQAQTGRSSGEDAVETASQALIQVPRDDVDLTVLFGVGCEPGRSLRFSGQWYSFSSSKSFACSQWSACMEEKL